MTDFSKLEAAISSAITELDSHVSGYVKVIGVTKGELHVTGALQSTVRANKLVLATQQAAQSLKDELPSFTVVQAHFSVSKPSLIVSSGDEPHADALVSDGVELDKESYEERDRRLHARVLYQGAMAIKSLTPVDRFKRLNPNFADKLRPSTWTLDFFTPIVVDRNFEVIDGNVRLELALQNGRKEVPVVVLDVAGPKADLLRLALNRSAEFQRWRHETVDEFVDGHPTLQVVLEPLGFFGKRFLPTSYFANTVFDYEITEDSTQQSLYRQEEGLAAWAKAARAEREAELAARKKRQRGKRPTGKSLLDLMTPKEEDYAEVNDPEAALRTATVNTQKTAATITENYDAIMRPKRGDNWQSSRRSPNEVVRMNREERERAEAEFVQQAREADELVADASQFLSKMEVMLLLNVHELALILVEGGNDA